MMAYCVFSNKNYRMVKSDNGFIVINIDKKFTEGHTHVPNFNFGKIIIYASIKGEFPSKCLHLKNNKRAIESVLRICPNKNKKIFEKMLENS